MNATKEQVWDTLRLPAGLTKHPGFGDLFTIDEFRGYCQCGSFVNSDGDGCWATETMRDPWSSASPSKMVSNYPPPAWATHVLWFNK